MIVLLPVKDDGITELGKDLNTTKLNSWLRKIKSTRINIYLPKFAFASGFNLRDTLSNMGMPDAFVYPKADFSGINAAKELYIGEVIHKSFVDVNEEGTEATGATAVIQRAGSPIPGEDEPFRADHPFIFLILDIKTGSILFMGRVMNPKE